MERNNSLRMGVVIGAQEVRRDLSLSRVPRRNGEDSGTSRSLRTHLKLIPHSVYGPLILAFENHQQSNTFGYIKTVSLPTARSLTAHCMKHQQQVSCLAYSSGFTILVSVSDASDTNPFSFDAGATTPSFFCRQVFSSDRCRDSTITGQ